MKADLVILIGTCLIAIGVICIKFQFKQDIYIYDNKLETELYKRDSIINAYESILNSHKAKIDSLLNIEPKIVTKYKTVYENYKDVSIVDDDSISRYISTKIHNR